MKILSQSLAHKTNGETATTPGSASNADGASVEQELNSESIEDNTESNKESPDDMSEPSSAPLMHVNGIDASPTDIVAAEVTAADVDDDDSGNNGEVKMSTTSTEETVEVEEEEEVRSTTPPAPPPPQISDTMSSLENNGEQSPEQMMSKSIAMCDIEKGAGEGPNLLTDGDDGEDGKYYFILKIFVRFFKTGRFNFFKELIFVRFNFFQMISEYLNF